MGKQFSLLIDFEYDKEISSSNYIKQSLNRYYKYTNDEIDHMDIHIFSGDQKYFKILTELNNATDEINTFCVCVNYEQNIADLLKSLTPKNGMFSPNYKWELFEIIKKKIFQNFVKSFSHGESHDLVNSPLGLIKIWCEFEWAIENIDSIRVRGCKTIEDLSTSLAKLDNYKSIAGIKHEIFLLEKNISEIIKLLKIKKYTEIIKEKLSTKLFYLFNFVSKYAK